MLPYHNKYLILISCTLDATGNKFAPYFDKVKIAAEVVGCFGACLFIIIVISTRQQLVRGSAL